MKHTIKQTLVAFIAILGIVISLASVPVSALAFPAPIVSVITCDKTEFKFLPPGQTDPKSCCPIKVATLPIEKQATGCLFAKYLNPIINLLSAVVGLAVVIGILFGAIQVSSSAGDPQKSASGKGHIRNALLGLLAYILLYTFLQFIIPGGKFN